MFLIDEEWNGGKEDQAVGRFNRIGQTENTTVHIPRIMNTIDTWLANLIAFKRNVVAGFENETQILSDSLLEGIRSGRA